MLGLVFAQNAGGLDLGSRSPGQLLVEVDHALHRDGIGVGTDRLDTGKSASQFPGPSIVLLMPARSDFSPRACRELVPMLFTIYDHTNHANEERSTALNVP